MNDTKFKENRELIKKRLSHKQRLPFEQLVDRNIHYGLNDELNGEGPMENIKKELQLHRKLLHRPQPSDIAYDSDLPNDLKKADSEYYKLYEYRDPIESISPNQNKKIDIIAPDIGLSNIENPLDWKFGQRSSAKEIQIRGIIPEQYADVVHGNKSLEDAKKEWEESKKEPSNKIKNKIDLKFRPTRKDLQDRGIVPDWENPNFTKEMKEKNVKSLSMKLKQRMDPNEADQRAIINKQQLFSNKDYSEHFREEKEANKQLKLKMKESLTQRSNKNDIIFRGIIRKEYLYNDVDIAKNKLKKERISVKKEINKAFGNRPNKNEIEKLYLKEMNDNGNVLIDIDELKRQIEKLKDINKINKINWENEKKIYENEIIKYKKQIMDKNTEINRLKTQKLNGIKNGRNQFNQRPNNQQDLSKCKVFGWTAF
eukprot:311999_1